MKILGKIDTKNNWAERKKIVLQNVAEDLEKLISDAHGNLLSLAVFKPHKILDFVIEETENEWDEVKLNSILEKRKQLSLFEPENKMEIPKKLPYKFSYFFEDINHKKSTLMIEDWEIGQLYWNCLNKHNGNEQKAIEDVRKKYFDDFIKTKNLYLFLGTTREFHIRKAKNPFVIIGTFYPKREMQETLF